MKLAHLDIFLKFKQCNFNITTFTNKYEYILRENSITDYVNNLSKKELKEKIISMIKYYNIQTNLPLKHHIIIAEEFPEEILIRIMKPYLHLKLTSYYSLVPQNKTQSYNILMNKLRKFQQFNPFFGRKLIKRKDVFVNNKTISKIYVEFNTDHIKHDVYEIYDFLNNHLSYEYNVNNIIPPPIIGNVSNVNNEIINSQEIIVVDILSYMRFNEEREEEYDELEEEYDELEEEYDELEEEYD
jgi:hypothetical protein